MQAVTDLAATTGVVSACALLGIPRSTYYRRSVPVSQPHSQPDPLDQPATVDLSGRRSSRALSLAEREQILALLNSERFADRSPREVYAALLDEGIYHCSWSTMYRLLRERDQTKRRRDQRQPITYSKPELLATRPGQLWSWDITKLKGPSPWTYFYLYVILDVFSRYVVGWMIALRETAELAEAFIAETCASEQIAPQQLTIHADRGSAMTSKCVAQLLSDLGVAKTHSRPHVSDDNPFSESHFKTAKYHPSYPERFGSLEDARAWARPFFLWYNQEHHHSALGLLTPSQVHRGQVNAVVAARQQVLLAAYEAHPERFVRGAPEAARPPAAVWINPPAHQLTSPPETLFPLSERSSPDQSDVAAPSRGFTAQRPLDGAATFDQAVTERPTDGKKQLDAP